MSIPLLHSLCGSANRSPSADLLCSVWPEKAGEEGGRWVGSETQCGQALPWENLMAEQELGNVAAATSAANPEVREGNEQYDPAKDPKRRAKFKDHGWQYDFWPNLGNKDKIQCKLCGVIVSSGIKRLKQHLAGGFGDVEKCFKTTTTIMREMHDYLKSGARNKPINYDEDDVEEAQQVAQEVEKVEQPQVQGTSTAQSSKGSWSWTPLKPTPSSGTANKRKLAIAALQSKNTNKGGDSDYDC